MQPFGLRIFQQINKKSNPSQAQNKFLLFFFCSPSYPVTLHFVVHNIYRIDFYFAVFCFIKLGKYVK